MGFTSSNFINVNENLLCNSSDPEICTQLVENCRATATEAYEEGEYSEATWAMFYYDICPAGGLDCIFDVYGG